MSTGTTAWVGTRKGLFVLHEAEPYVRYGHFGADAGRVFAEGDAESIPGFLVVDDHYAGDVLSWTRKRKEPPPQPSLFPGLEDPE